MENLKAFDWNKKKQWIDSALHQIRTDLQEISQSDKELTKQFIKMRTEIRKLGGRNSHYSWIGSNGF